MSQADQSELSTERYARENPAAFAAAMGDGWLAAVLRGEKPPKTIADVILEDAAQKK